MINIGIIGFGKMGKIRAKAIRLNGKAKIISVYDNKTSIDFEGYQVAKNSDDIINNPDINTVFICTPNFFNKPLTIQALKAGKNVFCEKPPAFNAKDVEEIREIERISEKKLMYGFNHRNHSSVKKMKMLIDSNEFGKVIWMRGRYGKSVDKEFFNNWRADKKLSGGGILIDQGIHMLDLFLFLGSEFDEVKAYVSNIYWDAEIEDNAFVLLKNTKTGLVASLHSTMTQWRHLFSLEVFMEKGYMVLNGLITSSMSYGEEVLSIAKSRSTAPAAIWKDEVKTQYLTNNSWRYEMEHFFNAIKNDTPIKIGNSNDALQIMKIIDEIYKQKEF